MVSDAPARPTRTTTENRVTALEAERAHMATKADIARIETTIEGMQRSLIMWLVGFGGISPYSQPPALNQKRAA